MRGKMIKKKIQINITDFPVSLQPLLRDAQVYDSSCGSCATVLYCDTGYYIKIADKGSLAEEAAMWQLFADRGLGAQVYSYLSEEMDYLTTYGASGEDLTHYLGEPEKICEVMAKALKSLHKQTPEQIPPANSMRAYEQIAALPLEEMHYNPDYVLRAFPITSRKEAWEIISRNKGKLKYNTLIHGDFCLPNVMLNEKGESTLIDFSQAGVGDIHVDLFWAIWSLQFNLKTGKYTDAFLNLYGREAVDIELIKLISALEIVG